MLADDNGEAATDLQPLRLRIRNAVSAKKVRREKIKLGGMEIELVQPTISQINEMGQARVIDIILMQARVPGTEETIFTEEDREWVGNTPMDEEWRNAVDAMTRLMGINTQAAVKNSEETPQDTTS